MPTLHILQKPNFRFNFLFDFPGKGGYHNLNKITNDEGAKQALPCSKARMSKTCVQKKQYFNREFAAHISIPSKGFRTTYRDFKFEKMIVVRADEPHIRNAIFLISSI